MAEILLRLGSDEITSANGTPLNNHPNWTCQPDLFAGPVTPGRPTSEDESRGVRLPAGFMTPTPPREPSWPHRLHLHPHENLPGPTDDNYTPTRTSLAPQMTPTPHENLPGPTDDTPTPAREPPDPTDDTYTPTRTFLTHR
ncbi:extensin-like [Homarus americanus]|uniref:extensin-like n=1 Tax=Homarus americanus TaxID=6706 RepID=UPI001C48A17D|nr:extensin-like [Homarus americanus]